MFSAVSRWFRRPRDTSGYIYYARIKAPQGTFYQLGYTSKKSLVDHMRIARLGDENLIDREFLFTFCDNAWDIEQILLNHFGRHRAFRKFNSDLQVPLAGKGRSELFAHDILGLDSEICRLSDEDMQEAGMSYLLIFLGLVLIPFTLGLSLLFIAGGFAGVAKSGIMDPSISRKPTHPPDINALIEFLVKNSSVRTGISRKRVNS